MQRIVAAACLAAGVFVLWGFGWALLATGGLLLVRDDRVEAWLRARVRDVQLLWSASLRLPRRALAAAAMGLGIFLAPVGAFVSLGLGVALMVASGLLLGFSVLAGQGA